MKAEDIKVGDVVSMNKIPAIIVEILDPDQSVNQRCWIQQKGEKYCVCICDLKVNENF